MDTVNLFKSAYGSEEKQLPLGNIETSTLSDSSRSYDISKLQWLREYIKEQEDLIEQKIDWCIKGATGSIDSGIDRSIINVLCEAGALKRSLQNLTKEKN